MTICWGTDTFIIQQDGITGSGLFAARFYARGSVVLIATAADIGFQPLQLVNHSCTPSCEMLRTTLFAIESLTPNEEITIDYRTIKIPFQLEEFDCHCGRRNCCGHIKVGQ